MTKNKMLIILLETIIILLIAWFLLPITHGIIHIGVIYPPVILAIIGFFLAKPDVFKMIFKHHKLIFFPFLSIFLVAIIGCCAIFCIMKSKADVKPVGNTVIVLGCQVQGDKPSLMLYDRMEMALDYLNENENSVCVASGGLGSGEKISEAKAIKDFLVNNGIDESRIFLEDKSKNTYENIKFSSEIIKNNGFDKNVVIATDEFHECRASMLCKSFDLNFSAKACKTAWWLRSSYWAREILAVGKTIIIGK